MHALCLKLGLYTDVGTLTCADLPGTAGYWSLDAETFAEWGVDYVKTDGCHIAPEQLRLNYETLGAALNATGRPMVYSCSWPWYLVSKGITVTVALLFDQPSVCMCAHVHRTAQLILIVIASF